MGRSGAMLATLLFASFLGAQTGRAPGSRPARTAADPIVRSGCPAAAPPVASDSGALSADFIELAREGCAGACPAYRVRVGGDGRVTWVGDKAVVARGNAADTIDSIHARELIQRAADRGFWGLCTRYARGGSDPATTVVTLSIAGHVSSVRDTGDAGPALLKALYMDIDEVANTHRWRHGEPAQETFGGDRLVVDTVSPKMGVTRLMRVVTKQDTKELSEMLADSSLDLNVGDSSGWTALMYAAQGGTVQAVTMLLQAKADPERRSMEGETAMFAAASSDDHPAAKARLLKAAGMNVNAQDHGGVTPLMIAARRFRVPGLIDTLIELAADPTKRDMAGRRAVDYLDEQERAAPDPVAYPAVWRVLVVR